MKDIQGLQFHTHGLFGLEILRRMYITESGLTSAPLISSTCDELEQLDLRRNKLESLPEDYFTNCSSLYMVNLGENMLASLPDFKPIASSLAALLLTGNALTSCGRICETHLPKLQDMSMAQNELTYFDFNAADLWPIIQNIMINHNRLKTIDNLTAVQLINKTRYET